MQGKTQSRNIRLPMEMVEWIGRLATVERRTWASMVRVLIEAGLHGKRGKSKTLPDDSDVESTSSEREVRNSP